ncbi:hypothetical protein Ancab_025509 [Ancistrocladus abbreviatus]
MKWHKEHLDLILVPSGLLIMFCYHLFLLYRCITSPKDTIIGFENHSRRAWAAKMMQADMAHRSPAFSVMSSNISAATFMASTSLALTSLIGTWVGSLSKEHSIISSFIYGDTSASINSLKYISILSFFFLAFGSFIQCARYGVHASFLLSMPHADVPVDFVERDIVMGNHFWQFGMRAIYFATTLVLWVFGPIPMFISSVGLVIILHILDTNKDPLHDFQQQTRQNIFKKAGDEVTAAVTAVDNMTKDVVKEAEPR